MDKIISVFLYYFIYFISFVFFIKADCTKSENKIKLYMFCGITILSIFAGFRGMLVGWDTEDTVRARFERVKYYSSLSSLMANRERIKEPIYWFISYFIRKVSSDSKVFLSIIQFLTVGPIALVAYDRRKELPVSIMMTVYMLLFYQMSFNIIRQSVAAAFLLLAYTKLKKQSYFIACVLALLCCLYHNSGFIGVALILLLYILVNNRSSAIRSGVIFFYIIIGVILLASWKSIVGWLVEEDVVNESYDNYAAIFSGEKESKYTTFRYRNVVIESLRVISTLFILFGLKGKHTGTDQEIKMLKYSSILSLIIYSIFVIGFNSSLGHRGTIYLDYLQMILYASYFPKTLFERGRIAHGRIVFPRTGVKYSLLYCFVFNLLVYMLINFGHTLPYQIS